MLARARRSKLVALTLASYQKLGKLLVTVEDSGSDTKEPNSSGFASAKQSDA